MTIPKGTIGLMIKVYKEVMPTVHYYLNEWKEQAESIPNEELRKQALSSINTKTFHCEGGGIYGILAKENFSESIRFIVAYQTISDYLDNLCDRSTSLDPDDFALLHRSMIDALSPENPTQNYYKLRDDQNDGGYLNKLVNTCQQVLKQLPHYNKIAPALLQLAGYYCDLQVHKHVTVEERVPRLKEWFQEHSSSLPEMEWYEFSACAGSTLGIFCLVSYAFQEDFSQEDASLIKEGLFPYVQGLHILLDYFIDQDEDKVGGDLNFCFYYPNEEQLVKRFKHFLAEGDKQVKKIPNKEFHLMINRGLIGIYLSDQKVQKQRHVHTIAKELIRYGGIPSTFFYVNARIYRKVRG